VTYRGHAALQADIDNLRNALLPPEAGSHSTEDSVASAFRRKDAFMSAPAPGTFGRDQNRYYKTQEEFLFAIADAVRVEYRAIVDAGFILQIDDPGMAENWDAMDASVTLEEYRTYARLCIGALNHAPSGIPEDRAREYEEGIRNGGIVMGVRPRSDEDAEYFENEWRNYRGENIYR
jgi:5-methyltetrahydropteroyltriglutamate--homocysteine methyltransferase